MHCGDNDLLPQDISPIHDGPYNSSLASSASSSSASVWSDTASHSDDSSADSSVTSDSESCDAFSLTSQNSHQSALDHCDRIPISVSGNWPKHSTAAAATEQKQNPRRTRVSLTRPSCPPSLVRQCDRKVNFVDNLVDSSAQIIEAIWPLSSVVGRRNDVGDKGVLPLRTFIQETLRRSRTSYYTLQVALYYLILIKPHVPKHDFTMEQPEDSHSTRALQCGRRMFLAALILASKYLQDRNYSTRAWSKISGLNPQEINQNEIAFLLAVNWELHIKDSVFQRWTDIMLKFTPSQPPSSGSAPMRIASEQSASWKALILILNPELDNVEGFTSSSLHASVQSFNLPSAKPFVENICSLQSESGHSTPTPRFYTPSVLEPSLRTSYPPVKPAPAFGLLPTPRLTPQNVGFNTPAVSVASNVPFKPAMCFAMARANAASLAQSTDRWPSNSPPLTNPFGRRPSMASSVVSGSSLSSPESMVSDNSSRSSRSGSISSASAMISAPTSSKLDVQVRRRCALQNNRWAGTLQEDSSDDVRSTSPEEYVGNVEELLELSLDTPTTHQRSETDYLSYHSADLAARTLQALHKNHHPDSSWASPISKTGSRGAKRARPLSMQNSLQENVRELLADQFRSSSERDLADTIEHSTRELTSSMRTLTNTPIKKIPSPDGRKRFCCSTDLIHRVPGPGMWNGILE